MQGGKGGSQGERGGKGWRKGASHQTIRRPHESGAERGESARPRLQLRTAREREFVDCGINRTLRRKGGGNMIGGGRPTKRGHANKTARSGTDLQTPTSILREILWQSGGA